MITEHTGPTALAAGHVREPVKPISYFAAFSCNVHFHVLVSLFLVL